MVNGLAFRHKLVIENSIHDAAHVIYHYDSGVNINCARVVFLEAIPLDSNLDWRHSIVKLKVSSLEFHIYLKVK